MKRTAIALATVLFTAGTLSAQTAVEFRGRGHPETDARIRDWLREPGRLLWTGDTTIARGDTVRAPVLIVGGTARIEGTFTSELVGIGADLFVRPSAQLLGDVVNLSGGLYRSDLATLAGEVDDRPNAPYELDRLPGRIRIVGTEQRAPLRLDGAVFGFSIPTYDRVDGLSLRWGATLALPGTGRVEPRVQGWAGYRSERGEFDGGGELAVARGRTELGVGAERTTLTNEEWIRGDLSNSIAYLIQGKDVRDYHEADRAWVEARRILERGERTTNVWLRGQVEEATSLRADDPWSIFHADTIRSNFPVDDGRITSLRGGAELFWERPTFTAGVDGEVEVAGRTLDGEHDFARYRVTGEWAMLAFRDHTLEIELHAQGPLPGTESLPRQRWSHIGGSGTLYTYDIAEFRGDRVVFVASSYAIPLGERLRIPYLGVPEIELLANTGMAWSAEQSRSFAQNIGVRLNVGLLYVRLVTDPDNFSEDADLAFGVSLPGGGHPWQGSGGFF